jgi:hypothetical protein
MRGKRKKFPDDQRPYDSFFIRWYAFNKVEHHLVYITSFVLIVQMSFFSDQSGPVPSEDSHDHLADESESCFARCLEKYEANIRK